MFRASSLWVQESRLPDPPPTKHGSKPRRMLGLKHDLDVAFGAFVEFAEGFGGLGEGETVADDLAGFGGAGEDHVAELGVPALVVVAAHGDADGFAEEFGPGDEEFAFCALGVFPCGFGAVGVLRGPDADDGDAAGGVDELGDGVDDPVGVFLLGVMAGAGLEADGVDGAGDAG
jgi:hypothetical protein